MGGVSVRTLESPRRSGPAPLSAAQRWQRWRERVAADPEKEKVHRKRKRQANRRQDQRRRKDPVAWEAFLERRRVYLRNYRRQQREQREAAAVA